MKKHTSGDECGEEDWRCSRCGGVGHTPCHECSTVVRP